MKTLYVDEGNTAEAVLANTLATGGYECIMVGAGLRIVPPYFLLFEKLMNVIHQHAPASTKLCFNTSPARHGRGSAALGIGRTVRPRRSTCSTSSATGASASTSIG